jgi:uncharacterized membrane protein YjjB (DUF3815 family)
VKTDDRLAFLAGAIVWVVALVAVVILAPEYLWTCVAGLAIGLIGLGWSIWRRRTQ